MYTIDPVYPKMFSLLLHRVFPTMLGEIPVYSPSLARKSQQQHVDKMNQHTRLYHETRVLFILKQMERFSVKSLPSQRFFNTNAGRLFNQHIHAWKIN